MVKKEYLRASSKAKNKTILGNNYKGEKTTNAREEMLQIASLVVIQLAERDCLSEWEV